MTTFETATLTTVALCSALVQFVAAGTMHAADALRIHLLMGAFLTVLLASSQSPLDQVGRFALAVTGIPVASRVYAYVWGPHPAFAAVAAASKPHIH